MSNKPKQYEGTDYSRQMVVIDTDFYGEIQAIAKVDPKRPLKGGDVFKIFYDLAMQYAPQREIADALELARQNAERGGAGKLKRQLNALPEAERAKVLEILAKANA